MIDIFLFSYVFVDYDRRMSMINRPFYLDRIQAYLDKPIVKVVTGMRRVGKSTLLVQVREGLVRQGIPEAQMGSSRITGESRTDLEEEVIIVSEAVGHPLDDLDFVVDAFQQAGIQVPAAMG